MQHTHCEEVLEPMSKITVSYYSPYVVGKPPPIEHTSISISELKYWIKSGKIFSHLLRYRESKMITYDLRLIAKPFALALIIKSLSRKDSYLIDRNNNSKKITFSLLAILFTKLLKDLLTKKRFLREMGREVMGLLQGGVKGEKPLELSLQPLYLRTDLCFGLQSGGSVGHIAGVLNNLSSFTGRPIFLTTDSIPTVNSELESHIIFPGDSFWNFSEMPLFVYNRVFFNTSLQLIGSRKPSFIYQRYSLNNFSGVKLARHYRVPFVLEFNGSEIWVNRNWGNALRYESLAEQIELLNIHSADVIVVVSQPLKNELMAKGIAGEKILVNPNGVDTEKYSPSIEGSKIRKLLELENKTVFGFIGTFGQWHGAEVLAEAFGRLLQMHPELRKRVHLLMIGDGITMPIVKETLNRWNAMEACTLTGTIHQEKGPSYLAACDILVSPHVPNPDGTPFFGSPTKLFEYMAMGKGIVASDLDQIGEILKHNHSAWMVKPGDPESLMNGLKTLIGDPVLRQHLGQAAREEVVAKFTWKEHTRKIIEKLCERT